VAGTVVLRDRPRRPVREPVPSLSWSRLEARAFALDPAAARGLAGRDLAFLRELLTRTDLAPAARAALYARAARHYATRMDLAPRALSYVEARTFLRELFLLLREVRGGATGLTAPAAGAAAARGAPPASGSAPG
jgi:hypothetical protein